MVGLVAGRFEWLFPFGKYNQYLKLHLAFTQVTFV